MVATIYGAVKKNEDLSSSILECGSAELRTLHNLKQAMKIVEEKLIIQLKTNSRLRWCAVCPKSIRAII